MHKCRYSVRVGTGTVCVVIDTCASRLGDLCVQVWILVLLGADIVWAGADIVLLS